MGPFTKPTDMPEPQQDSTVRKFLRAVTYPAAIFAGMWEVTREVHNSVYTNLKRYGAFDDILKKPNYSRTEGDKSVGLEMLNKRNGWARDHGEISVDEFLKRSKATKNEYRMRVVERMEQRGLGRGISNFAKKWHYIDSPGKTEALLKGATVTGITAVVLSVIESDLLLKLMNQNKQETQQPPQQER